MENSSYKRRLDDMFYQSAPFLSSKRKRVNEISSSTISSKGQSPRNSVLEPFNGGYKWNVSASKWRHGTPAAQMRSTFAARPHVNERITSLVTGGPSECPRTPLRHRHYSPRSTWSNYTVAELSAPSPVKGLGLYNAPEVLSSSKVTDLPLHFARSALGYGSVAMRRIVDWSSPGENIGRIANIRTRPTASSSETSLNGLFEERLVSGNSTEISDLAKVKEENRALQKKILLIRERGSCNDLCSGRKGRDIEQADMTELETMLLKDYNRCIASLQGDDKRLSDVTKIGSNIQQARFVAPNSGLNKSTSNSMLEATEKDPDGDARQSGKISDEDCLASPNERLDGKQVDKTGDWKALYELTKSRDPLLNSLKLEQEYAEKQLAALSLNRRTFSKAVKKDERDAADAFTRLSGEADDVVDEALLGSDRSKVLTFHEKSSIDVTRAVMQCLLPGAWLNDEVINLYMALLKERELREPKKFIKCHFFNTFFYNKLYKDKRSYDYKAVRRWTTQKKLGYSLSDCDKILVPIHQDIHWCLAVINIRDKKFEYLDSLRGVDNAVLKVLARYIGDEAKDKDGRVLDSNTWEHEFPEDIPQQLNGCDCGMFMLKYADFHSRGVPLSFQQGDMQYFRRRMVWELLQLKAT